MQVKPHVHPGPVHLAGRRAVELRRVEIVVEERRLGDVLRLDRPHAALRQQPLEHEPRDVDRVGRRSVDHRVRRRLLLPVKRGGRDRQGAVQQIVAHDHERQARSAGILLRAGVDHPVLRDVNHPGEDVRRHIGHQRHLAGLRRPLIFDAADRLVGADVHVGGVAVELPGAERRNAGELGVLGGSDDLHRAVLRGLLDRLLRPFARIDVVGDGSARPACSSG